MSKGKKTHAASSLAALDPLAAFEFVNDDLCGAVSTFIGVTRRDSVNSAHVVALEFEAHPPLLIAALNDIIFQLRQRFADIHHVFVEHRLGRVPAGAANIIVAVSSPHRACAILAVQTLMEQIKASLPIWKKEVFDNDSYVWKQNAENHW